MKQADNGGHPHPLEFTSTQSTDDTSHSMPGPPSIFLSGNQGPQGTDVSITGKVDSEGGPETGPVPSTWFRSTPLADPPFPIIPASASSLDNLLLPLVGNSQQLNCDGTLSARRQIEDTNIINEYVNKAPPGSLWTAPAGYVTAPVANGTACTETLHDGLPDQWKTANGLSTTDPNLYKEITSDGYTVLERYNNGNGAAPPPTTVKCSPTATSNNCPSGTSVTTISGANVRNQPVNGVPGTIIGTQPAGAAGTTVGNPLPASAGSTFQWFNVNFTTGVSGWVGGDNLQTGSAPPPAVTGVTVTCPASVTVGDTINCTASVAPANASQAVTWTPTLPYKTTAAGPMNIKATSVQDTTKSGNATVQVNASSNCPTSGSSPVTITSGGFTFKGTCSWTMDYTTGVMTITGCQ
jgi:hypothetical protein